MHIILWRKLPILYSTLQVRLFQELFEYFVKNSLIRQLAADVISRDSSEYVKY